MKNTARENFAKKLDNFLLDNSSPKNYWKKMKMLIKSNKGITQFHQFKT